MEKFRAEIELPINLDQLRSDSSVAKKEVVGIGQTVEKVAERVNSGIKNMAGNLNPQEGLLERLKRRYAELRAQADKATGVADVGRLNREMQLYEKEILRVTRAGKEGFDLFGRSMIEQEGILQRLQRAALLYEKGMMEATRPENLEKYSQKLQLVNAEINKMTRGAGIGRASGWNGLQNSINQISRELPAFAVSAHMGFLAISNNLPILADEIQRVRIANEELVKSGKQGIPVWRQLLTSLLSWQTAMSLGITLLVVYGRQIGEWVSSLFKGRKAVDELKESTKALNEAKLKGSQSAQSELTQLRALYTAATNVNLPMAERNKAVAELQKQYPAYLGNVNKEAFMAGSATEAYNKLTGAILANAQAKAYNDKITENAIKQLENEEKVIEMYQSYADAQEDYENKMRKLNAADPLGNPLGYDNLQAQTSNAKAVRDHISKQMFDLLDASRILGDQNKRFEQNVQDLVTKHGLSTLTGNFGDGSGNVSAKELEKYKNLLEKIADIDREYARKYMESEEVERLALRDKFSDLRSLISEFNADPKNRIKIDVSLLDGIESNALDNLEKDQYTAWVRKHIDGLDDLETKIETVGEQVRLLGEIPADQMTGSQQKSLRDWTEYLDNLNRQKLTRDQKSLEDLLKAYATFEDKRLAIVTKGEADIARLRSEGKHGQADQAKKQMDDELIQLFKTNIESNAAFKQLEKDLESTGSAMMVRALKAGRQTVEALIDGIENASAEHKDALKKILLPWFDQAIPEAQSGHLQNVAQLADGFDSLVNSAIQFDGSMSSAFKTVGGMVRQVGQMAQTLASVVKDVGGNLSKAGGWASIIGSVLSIFGSIWEAIERNQARKQQEMEERYKYMEDHRIKQLNLQTSILQKQLDLINDIYGVGRLTAYRDVIAGINKEQERLLKIQRPASSRALPDEFINSGRYKILQNTGNKDVDEWIARYNKAVTSTDRTEGGNIGTWLDQVNQAAKKAGISLQNLDVDLRNITDNDAIRIQSMIDMGSFDEATQKFLKIILDLREAEREAIKAFKEEITGTSFESLLNDTANLFFNSGENAGEAWAEGFDKIMDEYLMRRFSREFLEGRMQEWYDLFHELAEDGLTETEKDYLREQRDKIKTEGDKRLNELRDLTGIPAKDTASKNQLTASIRRDLTEETGSVIAGVARLQVDLAKQQLSISTQALSIHEQMHDATVRSLRHQAAIEANTFAMLAAMNNALLFLSTIATNSKPQKTARELGV